MRTAILLGCVYIGRKISLIEIPDSVRNFYAIVLGICMVMDLIEFFAKLGDKKRY